MTHEIFALLALIFYALVTFAVIVRQYRRSGLRLVAWLLYVAELLYVGLFFHWRANRRCPFPDEGAAIILANHRSPVDPLLIWMNNHLGRRSRRPRVIGFLMAREYYETRGLRWLCRAMECIPVERGGRGMRPALAALERLKQGHMLGVFPEGRINTAVDLLEGDTGIAWLALHAQVPVFPVFLQNSPRGKSMTASFFTLSRVRVIYGEPIDLSAYYDCRKTREVLAEVTDLLMRRLAQLGGVAYGKDIACQKDGPAADRLHVVRRA